MLKCLQHFLIDVFVCLSEILSSLGMTQDHIFYSGVYQHVWRNLSCVSAFFFKIHIFSAYLDIGSFYSFHYRNDINGRYAENYVYFIVCNQWF